MKHTFTCLQPSRIHELANKPRVTVMEEKHTEFTPWDAGLVLKTMDRLIMITRSCQGSADHIASVIEQEQNKELKAFSKNYQTFYKNLTDYAFVEDAGHVNTLKHMVLLKLRADRGELTAKEAMTQASTAALTNLATRMDLSGGTPTEEPAPAEEPSRVEELEPASAE